VKAEIRRDTGVRLPDVLIAATALEHVMNLATGNDRDFKAVSGLRIRSLGRYLCERIFCQGEDRRFESGRLLWLSILPGHGPFLLAPCHAGR
jgi:hypothetical protein